LYYAMCLKMWSTSNAQCVPVLMTYNNIEPSQLKDETLASSCWDTEAGIAGSKSCCQNKYDVLQQHIWSTAAAAQNQIQHILTRWQPMSQNDSLDQQ